MNVQTFKVDVMIWCIFTVKMQLIGKMNTHTFRVDVMIWYILQNKFMGITFRSIDDSGGIVSHHWEFTLV